ncbi:MAG: restriction endonuclease [Bacteroidota bacterium]
MVYNFLFSSDTGLSKRIKSNDITYIVRRALIQEDIWLNMHYKKISEEEAEKKVGESSLNWSWNKEKVKKIVEKINGDIERHISQCKNVLKERLSAQISFNWEKLKDFTAFPEAQPVKPLLNELPNEPNINEIRYCPSLSILDRLSKYRKEQKKEGVRLLFQHDNKVWQEKCEAINKGNKEKLNIYESAYKDWETRKALFIEKQQNKNEIIDKQHAAFNEKKKKGILRYFTEGLKQSEYPFNMSKSYQMDYNEENGILVVNFSLPPLDEVFEVKEIKFIQSKEKIEEVTFSESERNRLYDELLYSITLRTIHELFTIDTIDCLKGIVFNGFVESVDKGTGKNINACILSIHANKPEFQDINLDKVEPKTCFKTLKGVGSSKLHGLSPVAPIINIDKNDKRFVASYEVAEGLDESNNLGAMDWEDFEHLIRELFEKEFSQNGGEVKITQASRDGGVDAVAFDPDPIRGGKIVIQAKRYTNVVGVSAVRDLYGTVMNEGATKGILVTTSDYGTDSYEFAKGKPITLLNGGNLLHLLGKYGYKAHIDLKAAKKILAENEDNKKK